MKTFGGLHVLVNNAGVACGAPLVEFPLEVWRKTLDINLTGAFLAMQAALPSMARNARAARLPSPVASRIELDRDEARGSFS